MRGNIITILAIGAALAALVAGMLASGPTVPKREATQAVRLSEKQQRVLENWRTRRPAYRQLSGRYGLGDDAYSCPHSAGSSLAVGDFNVDGHEDFAVILRVRGGPSHLVVFNGPLLNDMAEPTYEADVHNLGFFWPSVFAPGRLHVGFCVLGPDASPGLSLAPRGNTYVQELVRSPGGA